MIRSSAPWPSMASPVADVDPQALRSRIALVPQDVALFDDTIVENIRYGRSDASDADVKQAAAAAPGRRLHRGAPAGICNPARGARGDLVGRAAPAHRARPRRAARRADPAARRGHQRAGCGKRGRRAARPWAHHARTARRSSSPTGLPPCSVPTRILVLDKGEIVEEGTPCRAVAAGRPLCAARRAAVCAGGGPVDDTIRVRFAPPSQATA